MTCPRTEDLNAYADQALPPREQARLRQHLPACPVCRQQLSALQALRQDLRALPSPTLGFDLAANLQPLLQRPTSRPPPRRPRLPWRLAGWMPAGLTAGAALLSGLWLGGLLLGGAAAPQAGAAMARVFDPVPPGGLCAAPELCRTPWTRP